MSRATTMIALSLQIIITCFLFTATTASSPNGFTADLIHRRSNIEVGSSPYADTVFENSTYLMKLQIGTPPFEIEAILDTGSDLFWTQCLPCLHCYDQQAPIFDPSKSSTFKEKRCNGHSCPYEVFYGDGSYSTGTYATETVTIHSTSEEPFVMAETIIGCGRKNSGFRGNYPSASGIVGLDWVSSSLVSQMGEDSLGLLSYCLAGKGTSKINFGGNAIVAGDGTVSANMFLKTEEPGLFYLNLDAVSVGENRVETLGHHFTPWTGT